MMCKELFIKSEYVILLTDFLPLLLEDKDSLVILNIKKHLKFLLNF